MEKQIWDFLINSGFNGYAAAGIMGNLFAESGLKPTNVENSSGLNDEVYTQQVDNGIYKDFITDSIGYGLAQWTAADRKEKLYKFLKQRNLSIGDLYGQLEFLIYELKTSFKNTYQVLLNASSVIEASNEFLVKFENPKDKSDTAKRKRSTQGFKYYNKYKNLTAEKEVAYSMAILRKGSEGPEVETLQNDLISLGYDCGTAGADGEFGEATLLAVIDFQNENGLEADGEVGPLTKNKITALKNQGNYKRPAKNTNYTASRLIAIANAEVGYREKNSNSNLDNKTANAGANNFTKYARDLAAKGYYNGSKQGYAWCDVFVDWCFLQLCGGNATIAQQIECQTGSYGAGCMYSAQYYQQQGRWSSNPALGAQIFFYVGGAINHTGIVTGINGSTITTVEGNSSDQVARRTYNVSDSSIAGYGLPKYEEEKAEIEDEVQNTFTPYKVKITAKKLNIRAEPSMESAVIAVALKDQIKEIIAEENSFGKLGNEDGWILLAYTKL